MTWQPIGTAPKDGTEVWAFNGEQARMKWISCDGYGLWIYADELLTDADPEAEQPTHWMALPEPPLASTEAMSLPPAVDLPPVDTPDAPFQLPMEG